MTTDTQDSLSTRVKVASGMFLFLLVLVFIPARWFGLGTSSYSQTVNTPDPTMVLVQQLQASANDDSDGDGIPNWQETLLGTNPNSPTTNGVLDQTKLEQLHASSNTSSGNENALLSQLDDPNNITGQIAKNNVGLSVLLGQDNQTDSASAQKVGQNIADNAVQLASAKTYTETDVQTTTTESFSSIASYGNTLATLLLKTLEVLAPTNDLAPIQEYLLKKSSADLYQYDQKVALLAKTRDTMLAMRVPPSAKQVHVRMINAIEQYRNALYNFSKVDTDAMRSVVSLNAYKSILIELIDSQKAYMNYFDSKNVVFGPKDPGYFFMQNL